MQPTDEQFAALDLFREGETMVIDARAGTGKTSTLMLLAADTKARGQYLAFNKQIVSDVERKLPETCRARTAHSLAYGVVGKHFRHRLNGNRIRSDQVARSLGLREFVVRYGGQEKRLAAGYLASTVMQALQRFCQTADEAPTSRHFTYIDGIDLPAADGARTYVNNDRLREHLFPYLERAWADVQNVDGFLPYGHHCQPPGTLVRRVTSRQPTAWEEVPIEQIKPGDYVVSLSTKKRRGYVRRQGRRVTAAGSRWFTGDLVRLTTERGRTHAVTPDHRCVVRLDSDLTDGNYVVYMARRGDQFRIGRTTWRTRSQSNTLGIRRRAESQRADAMWVLSVHPTDGAAATAEAITAFRYGIPTWTWDGPRTVMDRAAFWAHVGSNISAAVRCLAAFGHDSREPLWSRDEAWSSTIRPLKIRARHVLSGMLVCEPDEAVLTPSARGTITTNEGSKAWARVTASRERYDGPVYNLDVEEDHTYVADGIVTGNCYLKTWQLREPKIPADYIMFDEAQDASAVMAAIVAAQKHAQCVYVGDEAQSIYAWNGAVDAMAGFEAERRAVLSQSFRFGPAIAFEANLVLAQLGSDPPVRGLDVIADRVDAIDGYPDAILCRTNASTIARMLDALEDDQPFHLVGGGKELVAFARGAQALQNGQRTSHYELACFDSWNEAVDYTERDPDGVELKLLVSLITKFGAERIIEAVDEAVPEGPGVVSLTTAHKAKGREWDRVRLDMSMGEYGDSDDELRLRYVAMTRARLALDLTDFEEGLARAEERARR